MMRTGNRSLGNRPESPKKPDDIQSTFWGKKYPKIQLLTIAELLDGKKIDMPPIRQVGATFKKAERHRPKSGEQLEIKESDP